jgi:iron complex outermembrane receptor protein
LITSGVDFADDNYRLSSLFGTTSDSQQKYGLFGLLNIPITSRLTFSAGARGAQQKSHLKSTLDTDFTNSALATTIGATFQLNPWSKIYLRRAESFRFPKADEDSSTSNNVGLKTQKGVSYETGMKWSWKQFVTKASVYQLNLVREITFDPDQTPQNPFGTNRNLDPTVRQGFLLAEKIQASEKFGIAAQYNYVNAHFASGSHSGNRIPLVAENFFHAGVDYKITDYWNIYTEASYIGNQYSANDDANTQGKIGGYTIYNVNLRCQYQHLTASFRVNNIFNKYYYYYTTFQPSMHNVFFYPAAGRNILLTIKYEIT